MKTDYPDNAYDYFERNFAIIENALKSINKKIQLSWIFYNNLRKASKIRGFSNYIKLNFFDYFTFVKCDLQGLLLN